MTEMKVEQIGVTKDGESAAVFLKETGGEGVLPIVIAASTARAIAYAMNQVEAPRPLTHDLIGSVISALNATIQRVVIHDLKKKTFVASLDLETAHGVMEIDARPSDAIALAVRDGAPIYCDEIVLIKAAVTEGDLYHSEGPGAEDPQAEDPQ